MTKKYKILGKFIKDMSSETPDIETYLFVRDRISKYQLGIDINSKPLKSKIIEINTILKFEEKENTAVVSLLGNGQEWKGYWDLHTTHSHDGAILSNTFYKY